MAAADLIPVMASSKSLCLTSKPLPLAITGLPNSAVIVAFRFMFVSLPEGGGLADELAVAAGAVGNDVNNTPNPRDKNTLVIIFIFCLFYLITVTTVQLSHC